MVLIHIKIHHILYVLQICGTFTSTWPPESMARKREIFLRDLGWILGILNVLGSIPPLILGAWYSRNDVIRMMKSLSELTALMEVLFNLILCRMERSRLQNILAKLKDFLQHSKPHERHIIQKYINRYINFSIFVGTSYILAAIAFSCGPLFLPINLPMEAWYPFSTEDTYIKSILYVLQVFAILQTGFCITVDFMIAMLFWFPAARLEMLGQELQQVTHVKQMKMCIQKHQEIISFVDDVRYTVRYLICKSNITMASAVIFGAFPLIHKQPLAVTTQFICMVLGGCERLYITAWPADDLAEISQQISWSAYTIPWFKKSEGTIKNVLFFLQRSKKPLLISMGGLFPVLSIQYYANYLLEEVENYLQTGNENDINILQKHMDRYTLLLAANTFLLLCSGLIICFRPLITKDTFPVDVWYPSFMTITPFRICLIYISQILSGIECVLCFNTDITIALFCCYSTAKLEILQHNLQISKSKDYVHKCIKQHQDIIKFVNLTQVAVQYLILKLNLTMGTAAVCSLFPLIIDQPLAVKSQFIFTFFSACERFYISAWSATDLSEMSKKIAYSSSFESYISPGTMNDILFLILRSQRPLTISMASFLPVLSLEYFGNFMAKAFSYFTAMKSIINT